MAMQQAIAPPAPLPRTPSIQPKLRVGALNDPLEREADRIADAVVSSQPVGPINGAPPRLPQRKCAECEAEETKTLRRKEVGAGAQSASVKSAAAAISGGGAPLSPAERAYFEPRFGHDLSAIRVHVDDAAASGARAIDARAFTLGNDIAFAPGEYRSDTRAGRHLIAHELAHAMQQDRGVLRRQSVPTGITLKESKPFGHADLQTDELKAKWRTYIGAATSLQVTPAGNYKGHCAKEFLTEVANTCPPRFTELRSGNFCTGDKCLDFDRYGSSGDAGAGKMVTDGPDSFTDLHRTRHPQSLLEGTGKNTCSVVCHQRYKFDRQHDLGSFYIIRNFRASSYTPPGSKDALHITTGDVQKVAASLEAPSAEKFAKDVAPGLKKSGVLADAPAVPRTGAGSKTEGAEK
jgi:hypothetical protein